MIIWRKASNTVLVKVQNVKAMIGAELVDLTSYEMSGYILSRLGLMINSIAPL